MNATTLSGPLLNTLRQTYSVPIYPSSLISYQNILIQNQQSNLRHTMKIKNIIPIHHHIYSPNHNLQTKNYHNQMLSLTQNQKLNTFLHNNHQSFQTINSHPKYLLSTNCTASKNPNSFNNNIIIDASKSHQNFNEKNTFSFHQLVEKQKNSYIQENKYLLTIGKSKKYQKYPQSQRNQYNFGSQEINNKINFRTKRVSSIDNCQERQFDRYETLVKKVYSPQFQNNKKINFTFVAKPQLNITQRSAINNTENQKETPQKDRISEPNLNLYQLKLKEQEEKNKLLNLKNVSDKSDKISKASSTKHMKSIQLEEVKKIIEDPYQFLSPQSHKLANVASAKSFNTLHDQKQTKSCLRKYSQRTKELLKINRRQKRLGSPQLNRLYFNTKRIQKNLIQKSKGVKQNNHQYKKKLEKVMSSPKSLLSKEYNQQYQQEHSIQNKEQFQKSLFLPADSKSYLQNRSNLSSRNEKSKIRYNPNCLSEIHLKKDKSRLKLINNRKSLVSPEQIKIFRKSKTRQSTQFQQQASLKSFKKGNLKTNIQQTFQSKKVILESIYCSKGNNSPVQFSMIRKLADNVFVAIHVSTNSIYCLKQLPLNQQNTNSIINQYKNLMVLKNPNILKVYGIFKEVNNCFKKVYLLTEYLQDGTLKQQNIKFFEKVRQNKDFQHLRNQDSLQYQNNLKCKRIFYFLQQTVKALKVIHNSNIIHRDIKPMNIFKSNKIYKIGDFGSSTNNNSQQYIGTLDYVSPQILLKEPYGKKIDVWSLGCIIYQMYAGFTPFYDYNRKKTFQNIIEVKYNQILIKDKDLSDLISKMLQRNPQNRIQIEQILNHKFITKFKKIIQG